MTDRAQNPAPLPPKEDPESLVLRGRARPAVRFRRGLIVGIAGAAAVSLVSLSWLALQPPSFRTAAASIETGDEEVIKASPDALANAPRNYGEVPRLGPPLPGDLGRAILDHERNQQNHDSLAVPNAEPSAGKSAAEAEREPVEAARTAGLMVQLGAGQPQAASSASLGAAEPPAHRIETEPASALTAGQQHKIDFVQGTGGSLGPKRPTERPEWTLSAGTVIPASLITGLNSDLPGMVLAQVTENVRDSATGRNILVPQGSRLIGKYDSVVAFGQRRALLIWSRLVFPDGSSVELDHMPATDASGFSGLGDGVDSHGWQLLKGIAMSTSLGVGTQLGFGGSGNGLIRALRESAQENAAHAGDQITSRNLDIQPTITVRPGWPVRALVNNDLVLQPWKG